MNLEVFADADAAARQAATVIAAEAKKSVAERGRFVLAVSGGTTPWKMLRLLASEALQWPDIFIAQVDERVAPDGDPDRNLTHIRESLLTHCPIREEQILAMPVLFPELEVGAAQYSCSLQEVSESPPVIDLVHLGLGPDGHTASLVPGDPVLSLTDRDVGITGEYQGRRRMTLTYHIINRSRKILWLVTGASKADMLPRLMRADTGIPAGRIKQEQATVMADREAAAKVSS